MSDEPTKRRPDGTILPGVVLNPKGRAQALPVWFVEKGPDALKHLLRVASGEVEDVQLSQATVCLKVVERIYGTAPKAPEDSSDVTEGIAQLLLAVAGKRAAASSDDDG